LPSGRVQLCREIGIIVVSMMATRTSGLIIEWDDGAHIYLYWNDNPIYDTYASLLSVMPSHVVATRSGRMDLLD